MYDRKVEKKKERLHNQTKIRGKEESILTSPKKDMYIMYHSK